MNNEGYSIMKAKGENMEIPHALIASQERCKGTSLLLYSQEV